jgi:cell division protein FtsW
MLPKTSFQFHLGAPEKALLIVTALLCVLGLLFVFEASVAEAYASFGNQFYFFKQQALWLTVGIFALVAGIYIPSTFWKKISVPLYCASILALILVFIPGLGKSVNGAHRWIAINSATFQPVELLKFSLIIFFASWMEKHHKLAPFLFLTLLPVSLLLLQPDLGSALIVLAIAFGLYFLAGAPYRIFAGLSFFGVIFLTVIILFSPYRAKRLTTFLNPDSDPLGASFHIHQITLALGNGGILGQGIGQSRQKFSYLPEASTDSIFAIVAEEVGFVGSMTIIFFFFLFVFFGYKIVRKIPAQTYDHFLAAGVFLWISTQILLNLSAIVALVPLTGIPLPFFSYGGSALVMILLVTGILIGAGKRANV